MARTWILQSNADRIDHGIYLVPGGVTMHGVRRYPNDIAPGDRVLLWRARGRTKHEPGIVALGTVVEPASLRAFDRAEAVRDEVVYRPKLRVVVRVDEVRLTLESGMISRDDVRRLPEMATHPIVTSNTGSDFALSSEQAEALIDLWGAAGQ
ncbi:MAG: EVE domain-containing protein [Fimbriimonas sp.]